MTSEESFRRASAIRAGFRVVEIPIVFIDREVGGSKMGKSIVAEAIWKVPLIKLERWRPRIGADGEARSGN